QIDHTVLQEVQPGYKLYERVMVPAKVIVNKLE
ncbi:MAG: nucleotide exchange factor GrpE, partial [Candidatus Komeilibacteria bacterium CG_4_9_14_3_um_filter_37_5]